VTLTEMHRNGTLPPADDDLRDAMSILIGERQPKQFTWRDVFWANLEELAEAEAEEREFDGSKERIAELLGFSEGDQIRGGLREKNISASGKKKLDRRAKCPNRRYKALVSKCGRDGKVVAAPCRSRRCKVCRNAWLQEMQDQYRPLIEGLGKITSLRFATMTERSTRTLEAGLDQMNKSMARLQRTTFWKRCVVGAQKRYEWTIKWSQEKGGWFHVHAHLALAGKYIDHPVLKELWIRSTEGRGEIADIRMVYDDAHITEEQMKWRKKNPNGGKGQPMSYRQVAEYLCEDIELPPEGNEELEDEIFEALESRRLVEPLGLFRQEEYEKEVNRTAEEKTARNEALMREIDRAEKSVARLRKAAKLIAEQMDSEEGRDDYALRDKQIDTGFRLYMARELRGTLNWARYKRQGVVDAVLPVIGAWLKKQAEENLTEVVHCRACGCTEWNLVSDRFELRGLANSAYYETTIYMRQLARSRGLSYDEEAEAVANEQANPAGVQAQTQGESNQEGGAGSEAQTRWYQETIPFNALGA
jgi:FAD/FMN-containing dehydrogenase